MIGAWLAAHKSLTVTAISATAVVAVVATLAVVSGGYSAQRMDLGDAAVWVTSQSKEMLGRANTQITQLNTVVPSSSRNVDVAQDGTNVLMVDLGNNTVGRVDPATASTDKTVPLPPREPVVQLDGERVAIGSAATGQVWLTTMADLTQFSADAQPSFDLGGRAVTSMDDTGTFFAYLPGTHQLRRVDTASSQTVQSVATIDAGSTASDDAITSVDGQWALLDSSTHRLFLPRGTVDLSSQLSGASDVVLQKPSVDGDTVYIASSNGLLAVPLADGAARTVTSGSLGRPAAPIRVGGCVYAAWAGGASWKSCGGASEGSRGTLPGVPANAQLAFRVNGAHAVLNDTASGTSWAVQSGNALIDNWDELIVKKSKTEEIEQNNLDTPPVYEKAQVPPVAVDDHFGARPGRANPLPVLLNDYDPNGDVLVIASTTGIPAAQGRIDIINNAQMLQLTLPTTASGTIGFDYTITDGRGGSATAHVTVTVRTPNENSPPVQVRHSKGLVQAGGRITMQVLGDWYDPDGDPFYLESATVAAPDTVTFTPQGTVVYSDKGAGGSLKTINLVVSDSRAEGTGTLAVTVRPAGSVPIIADPFVALASAGQEIAISPLDHVRGGTGIVRLSSVPAKPDATLTPDYEGGTFRFSSTQIGTHYVDYAVTDGVTTTTGLVRVDVQAPPEANTQPVAVPHTAFIHAQSTQEVDVLATDFDPAGGVLLITGVSNVPPASGLRVEILQESILRVTLARPLDAPVEFNYRISNGLSETQGTVTVIQIPQPAVRQPPIANPDSVSVRVGAAIDIPVLDNDSQPDGDQLTLDPTLVTPLPAGAGLLFASGDVLRYLAPNKAGNFTATYRVTAPDGQWATAQVKIAVRELDAATNNPPVPKTVTARVLAGDTVRIPIPLNGIDPDGDSVQLLGQESNPAKGAVTAVGSDWIDYQAGTYSAGTDTFTYAVVDSLGARATGVVRVGIADKSEGAGNPVAVEDEVTVRPGRTVSVQVLANDSDPDNSPLTITSVTPTSGTAKAVIDGNVVVVTAPKEEGRYGFIYEIQNDRGGSSSNFLTVVVSKDAPLSRPIASDTVLTLSDILGKKTVDVNVLANVFFADGPVSSLDVSLLPGYADSATVTSSKRIRVTIGDKSQIIPFAVAHPDDPKVVAYAFVWVPGYNDALPQLRRGARPLTVPSEGTLRIDLNDYVVAIGGKKVMLTDASTVQATHSNGANLVADGQTLVFTSAARYFGLASISFVVTDGTSPTDPNGHTATLVLPITVTPRENQPPVFTGALIDFEPGQQKTLDLVKLTSYPYAKDQGELTYTVLDPKPAGFTLSQSGQNLTITTAEGTPKGTVATVLVGVKDAINTGQAGRIQLTVVPSTRPLAVPAPDFAIAPRGQTTVVDVLANDNATNPFPSVPLRVIAVRGLGSDALPAGVSIAPSADNSKLSVTVSQTAAAVDTNLQYEVADATGDPDRYAWGAVRISVQDHPDPIANLQITGVGDHALTLSWSAGAFNNSPITGFEVTTTRVSDGSTTVTPCAATVCTVPTSGNGPDNAVRVSVTARNALGLSTPVAYPDVVWSNIVPAAPTTLQAAPLDGGLHMTWSTPPATPGASAITSYLVTVGSTTTVVPAGTNSTDITGLANGTNYPVTVASRNNFYGGGALWNTVSTNGTPAGPPALTGSPLAASQNGNSDTTVTVTWNGTFTANGRPISSQYVAAYTGAQPTCAADGTIRANGATVQGPITDGSTSAIFQGLSANSAYTFIAFAFNGQGCTASNTATVTPRVLPGAPAGFTASRNSGVTNHQVDFILRSVGAPGNVGADGTVGYEYMVKSPSETGWAPVAVGGTLDAGAANNGRSVTIALRTVVTYPGGVVLRSSAVTTQTVGVPVSTLVGGIQYDAAAGQITWTSWPVGPGYDSVRFRCTGGVMQPAPVLGSTGSCMAPPGSTLTVFVTVGTDTYSDDYPGGP